MFLAGADVNIVYPEDSHRLKPLKKNKEQDVEDDEEKNYKCTLIINYMRHNHLKIEEMLNTLNYLLRFGAKLDVLDSKGLSIMIYAMKHNSMELVTFLSNNEQFNIDFSDPRGQTIMHYCV